MKKLIALMLVIFIILAVPVITYLKNTNRDYNIVQTTTEKTAKQESEVFNFFI